MDHHCWPLKIEPDEGYKNIKHAGDRMNNAIQKTYEGIEYTLNNGSWISESFTAAPSGIISKLNSLLSEDEKRIVSESNQQKS